MQRVKQEFKQARLYSEMRTTGPHLEQQLTQIMKTGTKFYAGANSGRNAIQRIGGTLKQTGTSSVEAVRASRRTG